MTIFVSLVVPVLSPHERTKFYHHFVVCVFFGYSLEYKGIIAMIWLHTVYTFLKMSSSLSASHIMLALIIMMLLLL